MNLIILKDYITHFNVLMIYKITGMFADYIAVSDIIRTKMKNQEYTM